MSLFTNEIFVTLIATWLLASFIKYLVAKANGEKTTLARELVVTGGMPSGHSAVVSALATIICLQQGFSALFFVSATFGILVIRDSFGVRYSVGQQAKIINKLIKHDHLHEKLRIVAGHTVYQALAGILLGILIAFAVHAAG